MHFPCGDNVSDQSLVTILWLPGKFLSQSYLIFIALHHRLQCWALLTGFEIMFDWVPVGFFPCFSVGVLLTFVCNNRMSDTADRMKDTTYGILDEAVGFVNDTVGVRPHALYNAPASMNDTVGVRPRLPCSCFNEQYSWGKVGLLCIVLHLLLAYTT